MVRETRRSTRAEYEERRRFEEEKEKRDQERRLKQKLAKKQKQHQETDREKHETFSEVQDTPVSSSAHEASSSVLGSASSDAGAGAGPSDSGNSNGTYVDLGSDIIFEAKCHYLGWQARYDEWVVFPSDRVAVHHLHTSVTNREKLLREKKNK